ncbi:hypothetical protein [Mycobacterium terramassiliense]|uniref:Transmembrane protein n=1 Tax=Mycobacterium terramassiliense TaxID=1841859 RepID=A0A2U3N961_9MYCO|nr:hypothetical protein [Mycobacterium terramassiliense]SPM28068.1 hypothetical protein MTAB308_1553 [Mycobacterium terramassiliense]
MSTLSRTRGVRLGLGVLIFAVTTVITYQIARYRIFTGFQRYDDEGYMLVSLRSFLGHGWFYDVFNGYGPFHYEFWGAVFSALGTPIDHDGGRVATMAVWVLSSLLIGLSTWRMTGSMVLGLAAQLSTFEALFSLANEPMHPGGIIVLLLSVIVASSCFVRNRVSPIPMALLGASVMAIILVKINVGIFALAAVVLICAVCYPALARFRWLRPIVEVGFVALPLVVMSSKVGEPWGRHYAVHVSVAALAVVVALRARHFDRRDSKELLWLAGGILVVGLTILLATVARGTSPFGLFEAIVALPMRFIGVRPPVPLVLPSSTYVFDLLPLVGALGYWYVARNRETRPSRNWTRVLATLSILIGLSMAFAVITSITQFTPASTQIVPVYFRWVLLPFAWVALIQPPRTPDDETQFARLLLPPVAVLQTMHAYPVAGSQLYWATFLLIPVGAICIANGARWIAVDRRDDSVRRVPLLIGTTAALAALVVLVGIHLNQGLGQARAAYNSSVPLGLPGAKDVHVSAEEAANYRAIVAVIDQHCTAFMTLPGMNSFYVWTHQQPPTDFKEPELIALVDDAHQQQMIETIHSIDGLCTVENIDLAQWWGTAAAIPPSPLVRYLHHDFVPIAKFGDYEVLKHERGDSGP